MDIYKKKGKFCDRLERDKRTDDKIVYFKVEDKIDSDHRPITVWIRGKRDEQRKKKEREYIDKRRKEGICRSVRKKKKRGRG